MTATADQPDEVLDVAEAAAILKISPWTVREWARDGKIPAIRLGKLWRFRKSSLLAWTFSQERGGR